ncbi:hypothetical protein UlMin_024407 [Ulmus minor]
MVGSLWKARNRSWVALSSIGSSGGIVIIWDVRGVRVKDSLVGRFTVSIEVEEGGRSWWFTGVYGPNDYRERKEFWEELYGLHSICGPRWCLGGDFNVVRYCHEKSPPSRRTRSHSGFRQECEQWWIGIEVEGWQSYRMMEKLRALKDKIKAWNKEVFGDTRLIKKEVVEKIARLDKKEEMTQLDVGERELRLSLRNQRPFEEEEIKKAVFEIDREKSPGPDGYTGAFFQDCWGILKNDMVKIFEEFYRNGKVCGNMNHTFLCLIPKKLDVQQILAKLLANRLREVLEETISMAQGAFVHNRQILDVVLVASEAVEDYRKRKKKGVIFKVDFEKVYDHVNWDFLDLVLEKKGFGARWRSWMRGCISSANFSIMINGKPRGRFGASRGLRQGDPLSPFLFILVADILGRIMDKAVSIGEVKGFKVGREEVVVSHLQFADDTLFLLDPDQSNIQKVHTILNFFSMCSGLKINMNKSSLAGIHMEDEEVMALAAVVGCEKGSWPMKYLGLPLGGNPNSTEFWNPVSVLSSIPIYFMSLFKLPNGVAALLEKMMRQFLWDKEVGGKGKSLVDWKLVCSPKECGGLGIGNLLIRNKALLGKWLWRFPLEQHTLWAAVIKSKYGLNREGWDTNLVTVGSFRSPWKFIAQGTSNFLLNTKWVVGRGDRILFWHHAWVDSLVLKLSYPRLFRLSNKQSCVVNAETADHLFLHCMTARYLWVKVLGEVGLYWVVPATVKGIMLDRTLGFGRNKMAQTLWNCMVFSLLWNIWMERNSRIFEDKESVLEDIYEKAKFSALLWAFTDKSFKGFSFSLLAFNWKDVIGVN